MEDSFFKMKRQKETIEKNTEMRRNVSICLHIVEKDMLQLQQGL